MRFSVNSDQLRVATNHARSTTARGHTSHILANVLIEADGETARFRATDTQTELEATLAAQVDRPGGTTVSAATLNDLARRLPTGTQVVFEFHEDQEMLQVIASTTDGNLLTLPKEDFPRMAEDTYETTFQIDGSVLRRLFNKSKIATAPDSPRVYLQGVFFHFAEGSGDGGMPRLRCVSSDGYQLVRIDAEPPTGSEQMKPVIVPLKAVQEVIKMVERDNEKVEVSVSESKIRFATPRLVYSSRVLNGVFPNYTSLIPTSNNIILTLDSDLLLKALLRLSAVVPSQGGAVLMDLTRDHLKMTVNSPLQGTIQEDFNVAYPHKDMKIKFTHNHLLGVCEQMEVGLARIAFQDPPGATLFTSDADAGAFFVVMPVKV